MAELWERTKALECFSTEDKVTDFRAGHFFTRCYGGVRSSCKETGQVIGRADCEDDPVLSARLDSDSDILYTAHKSKLIRAWLAPSLEALTDMPPLKTDHKGPIVLIVVKGQRLITASAESIIKVWNLGQRHCSGVLRQCTALPLCLEYAEFSSDMKIAIVGTNSGSIHAWNADTNDIIATGTKHFSQVVAIKALSSKKSFVSVGRDKTMIFWSWNLQPTKVIPVFEEIETIQMLPWTIASKLANNNLGLDDEKSEYFVTGGEKGRIRLWNCDKMVEILPQNEQKDFPVTSKGVILKGEKISDVFASPLDDSITIVQDDIFVHCQFSGKKNKVEKFVVCANQYEALDMAIVGDRHLVVATMSSVLKVYDLSDNNKLMVGFGGHTASVLAVYGFNETSFVTCGKDHAVCLWTIGDAKVRLVAKGTGHSSFVGAVAASPRHIFSASKDGILKMWKMPQIDNIEDAVELQTMRTILAHDQEINSIDVSFDNEFVATASQDKSCKIWRVQDMGLLTTLTGHRRGIWRVHFTEDAIWTASGDSTLKKWSLKSFQTLSTLEGHLASVLALTFIDANKMASVASDGLLKVWDTKQATELGTFDAHEDKIWSVKYSEMTKELITAAKDGNIYFWTDKSEENREKERKISEELVKTEQTLANYLQGGKLDKALRLSLRLDRPRQTKKILQKMRTVNQLEEAIRKLDVDLKNCLLKYVTQWNTIGGASCELAQAVMQILLVEYLSLDPEERGHKVDAQHVAGLLAYSDKHFRRLDKLQSRSAVVDLLLEHM